MTTFERFDHRRPQSQVAKDLKGAVTRALREGLTPDQIREIVAYRLTEFAAAVNAARGGAHHSRRGG